MIFLAYFNFWSVTKGKFINDIFSHQDWLPTVLAAAGEPNVKEKLLKGYQAGDKTFKAHLDEKGIPYSDWGN